MPRMITIHTKRTPESSKEIDFTRNPSRAMPTQLKSNRKTSQRRIKQFSRNPFIRNSNLNSSNHHSLLNLKSQQNPWPNLKPTSTYSNLQVKFAVIQTTFIKWWHRLFWQIRKTTFLIFKNRGMFMVLGHRRKGGTLS